MARYPRAAAPPPREGDTVTENPLKKEAQDRLKACRAQKLEWDLDIRESYFFAAPHRARDIRSEQIPQTTKPKDADEQQTGIASELARDFCTEVVNAFMPEAEPWAEQGPGVFILDDKQKAEIKDAVKQQDIKIFEAIKASNLYTVLPMAFSPDLAVGTAALWIDDPFPGQNFVCQAVPLRELEINIGPHSQIDDRFIVRHTKNRHVKALLSEVDWTKVPKECREKIEDPKKADSTTEVRWGFWRKWDRRDDIVWQHVIMVKDDIVHETELTGAGACPLLVMRFNPLPEWAYAAGPLIEALPDLRQYDALEGDKVDHIELKLRPPTGYPDDSFAAVEDGIEAGAAYPIRPGSEDAIKPIFDGGDAQAAIFETAQLETRLRRKFFLDFPEQRGKTPPTLGQWLDEMARAQRRIGMPGASFWREGPAEIFLRFKHLLTKRAVIVPIEVNGKAVMLTPFNPAQRAAEQQEVAQSAQYISLMAGAFPEEYRLAVDGPATMKKFKQKMRASLIVERAEGDIKQALDHIGQLIQGRQQLRPANPATVAGQ